VTAHLNVENFTLLLYSLL